MDAAGFAWLPWILVDGAVVGNLGRLWARTLVAVSKPEARLIKVGSLNAVPPGSKTSVVPYFATLFWKSVSAHFFPCLRFPDLIHGIFVGAGPTVMKTILLTLIRIGLTLQLQAQNNDHANLLA